MGLLWELLSEHGWVVVVYWLFNALMQTAPMESEIQSVAGRWLIRFLHLAAGSVRLVYPRLLPQFKTGDKFGRRSGDDQGGEDDAGASAGRRV